MSRLDEHGKVSARFEFVKVFTSFGLLQMIFVCVHLSCVLHSGRSTGSFCVTLG